MLTVSASSSHRSERVQNRRTSGRHHDQPRCRRAMTDPGGVPEGGPLRILLVVGLPGPRSSRPRPGRGAATDWAAGSVVSGRASGLGPVGARCRADRCRRRDLFVGRDHGVGS